LLRLSISIKRNCFELLDASLKLTKLRQKVSRFQAIFSFPGIAGEFLAGRSASSKAQARLFLAYMRYRAEPENEIKRYLKG
jgi:hypothetical protein